MAVVNICGTSWKIREASPKELGKLSEEELDGYCNFDEETLLVKNTLCPHRKKVVLTHEILHVIFDYVGVDDDEELVGKLEHHIYDLIDKFPEEYR